MTKPISPSEVVAYKAKNVPDGVIESWNEIIAKNWTGTESVFYTKDLITIITNRMNYSSRSQANEWLDLEPIYEEQGWKVEYTSPDYTESTGSYYTFTKKRR